MKYLGVSDRLGSELPLCSYAHNYSKKEEKKKKEEEMICISQRIYRQNYILYSFMCVYCACFDRMVCSEWYVYRPCII